MVTIQLMPRVTCPYVTFYVVAEHFTDWVGFRCELRTARLLCNRRLSGTRHWKDLSPEEGVKLRKYLALAVPRSAIGAVTELLSIGGLQLDGVQIQWRSTFSAAPPATDHLSLWYSTCSFAMPAVIPRSLTRGRQWADVVKRLTKLRADDL